MAGSHVVQGGVEGLQRAQVAALGLQDVEGAIEMFSATAFLPSYIT
jgi:hypothetical protein